MGVDTLTTSSAFNPSSQDALVFKFTNFVCESYNKSWLVFHKCRLKAVSRNKVLLNLNGTVLHPVNDISAHFRVFKRANGYKPWLFDVKFDACLYLKRRNHPAVNIVYSLFTPFSNINHSCPYVGAMLVKDLYLIPDLMRLPVPTGDYLLSMQWYYDKKLTFDTNVSVAFVEDLLTS
ncbi:uncharacterized protein LOC117898840 [Drosophila subobscura]|uniref:uncharacterized protein LOC117898840 n=1 Tax=Drosophila subobscura TaxID=7241 RepID=UPI00155B2065|nr:uncharacterized protein LOC117898840 [Drosophila subobscura]